MDKEMEGFYEILLKRGRREVYCNFRTLPLEVGEFVVVETPGDEEVGRVVGKGDMVCRKAVGRPTLGILRKAQEEDMGRLTERRLRETQALTVFRQKIHDHRLEMKPIDVDIQTDGKLIRFYFTADGRIDFRELVRDLAAVYRTRIELRQIGAREESRKLGGYGICGRCLCCTSFMREFATIPSQAARDQNLSSNPSKLAGVCGRLKCCLRYEHEFYQEANRRFPKVGSRFRSEEGMCSVLRNDIFRQTVQIAREDGDVADVTLLDIENLKSP
jgi:cell fate regulator YaaT (PSP1 superfamily)